MSSTRDVTRVLERWAFALELLEGASPRARTYQSAARTLFQLPGNLETMLADGSLAGVRGVGPSVLAVVTDVLAGREPEELVALEAQIPEGLFAVGELKGLGPAKVHKLWRGLGVTSLGELELACHENRLLALDGFGQKTQENILRAIADRRRRAGRMLRDRATALATELVAAIERAKPGGRVAIAGGVARGDEVIDRLIAIVEGPFESEPLELDGVVPAVVVAEAESFGVVLVAETSDEAHWQALVSRAESQDLRLDRDALRTRDGALVPVRESDDLYVTLGLHGVAAERRRGDTLVARGEPTPRLVTRADLRGAIHNHTRASDGAASLAEMWLAAKTRGLEYLGITEHSESAAYARGLTAAAIREQRGEIDAINARRERCELIAGIESDILEDGNLDYPDDVLASLEIVVASAHRRFGLDRERATSRMIAAARHAYTDIVGHPTGRLLLGRPPTDFDMEAFLVACRETGTAVELNGSPHRLDLSIEHLAMAKAHGVLVSLAADAHATDELDYLDHATTIARAAGLTPDDILNTRSADEVRAWVRARRANALPH